MIDCKKARSILDYNKETGLIHWKENRSSMAKKGSIAGHKKKFSTGKKYIVIIACGKSYLAHRLAFLLVNGEMPTEEVDHIDGDGTNNSWLNLRKVSRFDNMKNRRRRSDCSTGLTGVNISGGLWCARVSTGQKRVFLGRFDNLFDAACARKSAELKYNYHPNHGTDRPL